MIHQLKNKLISTQKHTERALSITPNRLLGSKHPCKLLLKNTFVMRRLDITLKLVSAIFDQILIFHQMIALQKL